MEEGNVWAVVLMVLVLVLSLVNMGVVMNLDEKVEDIVDEKVSGLEMPSAEEIAALVPSVEIPEFKVPEFKSDSKVLDLWEDLYSEEISELEGYAYNDSVYEFEKNDYENLVEWLELNIEDFDELVGYEVRESDYEFDEVDVEVMELGLEKDEDKSAKVSFEVKVKYDLKEGADDSYKKYVLVSSDVSYEEGDFSDEDVKLVYSFE